MVELYSSGLNNGADDDYERCSRREKSRPLSSAGTTIQVATKKKER